MSPVPELDYNNLLYHERALKSVANSTRDDCRELLALAPQIPVRTEVQEFLLQDANLALNLLKQSWLKGAGVIKID